ncbi:hypothetical protein AGR7A_pAt20294 [Agrobacterium deltaense NCPPB 1641]|uniref:Uncharacterized protein n=1 Tax=Agrobacterium deltaense NCPPB 1641 TaxID=1183425 RepID=A0A1S7U9X2_9HYPH|nr:hypothetical protein AGR7A_pAt20294 [Agrobacterium deltaense NCPPB 1641]
MRLPFQLSANGLMVPGGQSSIYVLRHRKEREFLGIETETATRRVFRIGDALLPDKAAGCLLRVLVGSLEPRERCKLKQQPQLEGLCSRSIALPARHHSAGRPIALTAKPDKRSRRTKRYGEE